MRDDPTMKIMETMATMEAGQDPLLRLTDAERSEMLRLLEEGKLPP